MAGRHQKPCTCVCGSSKKPLVCPECIHCQLLSDREEKFNNLKGERDACLERLNELLERTSKKSTQGLRAQLVQQQQSRCAIQARLATAEKAIEIGRLEVAKRVAALEKRKERAQAQQILLEKERDERLAAKAQHLRNAKLTSCCEETAAHSAERDYVMRLLSIFPIATTSFQSAAEGSAPATFSICGFRLPTSRKFVVNFGKHEAFPAALGYLLFFVEFLASYSGSPLLHVCKYECSTSEIWEATSFYILQPEPRSSEGKKKHAGKGMCVDKPAAAIRKKSGGARRPNIMGTLVRTFTKNSHPPPIASASCIEDDEPAESMWGLLQRSLGCMLKSKALIQNLPLPSSWTPLQWLMVYIAHHRRDEQFGDDDVLTAARAAVKEDGDCADSYSGTSGLTAFKEDVDAEESELESEHGGTGSGQTSFEEEFMHEYMAEGPGLDIDDWETVATPSIPRPSESDAVEQWTRAMHTDAVRQAKHPVHSNVLHVGHQMGQVLHNVGQHVGHHMGQHVTQLGMTMPGDVVEKLSRLTSFLQKAVHPSSSYPPSNLS